MLILTYGNGNGNGNEPSYIYEGKCDCGVEILVENREVNIGACQSNGLDYVFCPVCSSIISVKPTTKFLVE